MKKTSISILVLCLIIVTISACSDVSSKQGDDIEEPIISVQEEVSNEDVNIIVEGDIIEETKDEDTFTGYVVGDTITFGKYEQDGDLSNGKEEIEWQVLSVEGNTVLVISKDALDSKPYNTEFTGVTWETCSLREWLNEDFINEAFSEEEQKSIKMTTVKNKPNPQYDVPGGNDTEDRVFLLSVEEAQTYFGDFSWYDEEAEYGTIPAIACSPSTYLIDNNLKGMVILEEDYEDVYKPKGYSEEIIGKPLTHWWLRSPGSTSSFANIILADGRVGARWDFTVDCDDVTVRPVMYIEFE